MRIAESVTKERYQTALSILLSIVSISILGLFYR